MRLEATIDKVQNDGAIQYKIKEIVKRQVEEFLSDRQLIFKLTLEPLSPCERLPLLFSILTIRPHTTQHNCRIMSHIRSW